MPAMVMSHDIDPREALVRAIGDLSFYDVLHNQVLVAVYQRGGNDAKETKTAGGIIIPEKHLEEDRFQSKTGLVIKVGPKAFSDPRGEYTWPEDMGVGDWVIFRVSDGWSHEIIGDPPRVDGKTNKILVRLLDDTAIKARIRHPDFVW